LSAPGKSRNNTGLGDFPDLMIPRVKYKHITQGIQYYPGRTGKTRLVAGNGLAGDIKYKCSIYVPSLERSSN